jgi:catechol 2,3-dioxygenase-like lactoylglutathione lyase family enzyme
MKRFHVHVNVTDLDASIAFYSHLFAAAPTRIEADYAKWMLDDPRINFAISRRERAPGVDHLGFQVESGDELAEIGARLAAADAIRQTDVDTTCCYARSDKCWSEDPQGLRWESFHTHGSASTYFAPSDAAACCAPPAAAAAPASCCGPSASATSRCG